MRIDWKPSTKIIARAEMINQLHDEKKMTYADISKFVGKHQSYVITLNTWYRNYKIENEPKTEVIND